MGARVMNRSENIVYLASAKTSRGALELCERLRELALRRLLLTQSQALDRADDAFFERAEKAYSNADQEHFFLAMRLMRLHRRDMEAAFRDELEQGFARLTGPESGSASASRAGDGDFQLMDEADVEETVALENLVSRGRSRNTLPIGQLVTRLDHLLEGRQVDDSNNPLDPRQIGEAFNRAVQVLEMDIQPKLILFKLFEKQLVADLPSVYDEANRLLADQGVLPKLKGASLPPRSSAGEAARDQQAEAGAAPEPPPAAEQAPHQVPGLDVTGAGTDDVFSALHELLIQRKYGTGSAPQGSAPAPRWAASPQQPPASLSDLVSALSALQQTPLDLDRGAADSPSLGAEDLKVLVSHALQSRGESRAIGPREDDVIDLVSMLFDAILDDPKLPHAIKALIGRLQIPLVKVALVDRSFFSNRKHPARVLINEMARAAVGWSEPADLRSDALYRHLAAIVDRVLNGFEDDLNLFQRLLEDLRGFVEQERERARMVEERTRQAAEGRAKVETAREQVEGDIIRRLDAATVPDTVRSLVEDAWQKVMFITCVKEGAESDNWKRQLDVLDRLVWSVQPKTDPRERQRLLMEIPGLLQDLRAGLNSILYNPMEMTRFFRELEKVHLAALAAPTRARPVVEPPPPAAEPEVPVVQETPSTTAGQAPATSPADAGGHAGPDEPSREAGDGEAAVGDEDLEGLRRCREQLEQIAVGTWFQFDDGDGGALRGRLSARLGGGRRYIFVNRSGFKMADRGLERLAQDLLAGRAAVLDDDALFDKALETVISNLRDLRAGESA